MNDLEIIKMKNKPKLFLSYAHEDIKYARRIFRELTTAGIDVWFDEESLLPGQKWRNEITKAIKNSSFFLALLSSSSVSKKGYVQKELKEAIQVLDELSESDVFIIPARVDNCTPDSQVLNEIHRVDLFESFDGGVKRIVEVVKNNFANHAQINSRKKDDVDILLEWAAVYLEDYAFGRAKELLDEALEKANEEQKERVLGALETYREKYEIEKCIDSNKIVNVGDIYRGRVETIMEFAIFITLFPGVVGLVHYTDVSDPPPQQGTLETLYSIGDFVLVKVDRFDHKGRIGLAMKNVG